MLGPSDLKNVSHTPSKTVTTGAATRTRSGSAFAMTTRPAPATANITGISGER